MTPKIAAQYSLNCLDLTSLNLTDTEEDIDILCRHAQTAYGETAAVCVWPKFTKQAVTLLKDTDIKVAAVANFPDGGTDTDQALAACKQIIDAGGDEIDLVFPYRALLRGDADAAKQVITSCKNLCDDTLTLKVILETGELKSTDHIKSASEIALAAGADFIKTSTGKTEISATLEAAETMLHTIKAYGKGAFKASGGIKDVSTATSYLHLAQKIMGEEWINPQHFRFGASGILEDILNTLSDQRNTPEQQPKRVHSDPY